MLERLVKAGVRRLMWSELRRTFRRVCWIGPWPTLPQAQPVILYANHHYFHDGYLLWALCQRLRRPPLLWMAERDRFPIFGPEGALPFPPNDPQRRARTIRRTARLLESQPHRTLLYFPEGHLHPPEEGITPFAPRTFDKLNRILPTPKMWWPVALHVTWWGEDRPTALLTGGSFSHHSTGTEREQLEDLLRKLRAVSPAVPHHLLLDGTHSPSERWSFRFLSPFLHDPASPAE